MYVSYRIDGVLQLAMRPIAKQFHSSIISRIKVMAELDIAEKRVPQDGRFKLRTPGKTIDFRVSIMPSGARRGRRSSESSTRNRSASSSASCGSTSSASPSWS